jgi:Tfp pilus assembly protein PilX
MIRRTRDQSGMTSIVVVSVLIILLTLVSLGFARIMTRSVKNSTNNETAYAATYAAQSGVNDLATWIRTNPDAKSIHCNDLIGTSVAKGPFYEDSFLSGSTSNDNSKLTCLLVNQRPEDLAYQQLTALKSKVIKLTTDTTSGATDSFMFSWQANDATKTGVYQTTPPSFPSETTWNNTATCKDSAGTPAACLPVLRITLYPIPTGGSIDNVENNSKTFFLFPQAAGLAGGVRSFAFTSKPDGSTVPVACSKADVAGFNGTSDNNCNVVINDLANVPSTDYFYARVTPIYNDADIKIKANDVDSRIVKFKRVQAILDVTAKVGSTAKRVQARVDLGGVASDGSLKPSPNVNSSDDNIPDYTVRSSNSICKRLKVVNSLYDYTSNDSANCDIGLNTPSPTINYFTINSIVGPSYVTAGTNSALAWQTSDATSCIGSDGWNGDKTPPKSSFVGVTGNSSQTVAVGTTITDYTLRCTGPGGAAQRTVTAWPQPTVSISGPSSYNAGGSYTISFSSKNAISCSISSSGNQPWNQGYSASPTYANPNGPSDSRQFNTSWDDNGSKSYTVTCRDSSPTGRPVSASWSVGTGGSNTRIDPPTCSGDTSVQNNGDGTDQFIWGATCPDVAPSAGVYCLESSTDPGFTQCNVSNAGGPFLTGFRPGTAFCLKVTAFAGPWGKQLDPPEHCATPTLPPPTINSFSVDGIYDQSPECSFYAGPALENTWWCRGTSTGNLRTTYPNGPECADGVHAWTVCGGNWGASQNSYNGNQISRCEVRWNGALIASGGASGNWGNNTGIVNVGLQPVILTCWGYNNQSVSSSYSGTR